MKPSLFILSLTVILCSTCANDDTEPGTNSACLEPLIESILELPVQDPKARIDRYRYRGDGVYLVAAQNWPDGQDVLLTLDCEAICVFGGIDGPDNDCEDQESLSFVGNVWTDTRER